MNKKSLIIIGIILLAVIAGVFWYINSRQESKVKSQKLEMKNDVEMVECKEQYINKEQKEDNQEVVENKNNENSKEDKRLEAFNVEDIDTSNWKTYRNEEYGFEMKLPGDSKKWNMKVEHVDKLHSKFNSSKHYIIWFNYPLDQKMLQSENQPGMGYITSMDLWYIEVVDIENYQEDACEIKQIPKCRMGGILARNDKYVFTSGFPNLWTPCMPNDKEAKNQKEFCYVDQLVSSEYTKKYIDFKFIY
jgi:hypothetical protein